MMRLDNHGTQHPLKRRDSEDNSTDWILKVRRSLLGTVESPELNLHLHAMSNNGERERERCSERKNMMCCSRGNHVVMVAP